jgi:hypothetical protein
LFANQPCPANLFPTSSNNRFPRPETVLLNLEPSGKILDANTLTPPSSKETGLLFHMFAGLPGQEQGTVLTKDKSARRDDDHEHDHNGDAECLTTRPLDFLEVGFGGCFVRVPLGSFVDGVTQRNKSFV